MSKREKQAATERLRRDPRALAAYRHLLEVAMARSTTTYGELAERLGLPRRGTRMAREVGEVLDAISRYEASHNRPLLSVLVFSATDKKPGRGFFALARRLGALGREEDENCFYRLELGAVYHTWS